MEIENFHPISLFGTFLVTYSGVPLGEGIKRWGEVRKEGWFEW